jgi:hypothetical protein
MVGKTTRPSIPFDPPCNCLDFLELLERSALSVLGVLLLGRDARLPAEVMFRRYGIDSSV